MPKRIPVLFIVLSLPAVADPVRDFWFDGAEINRYELTQVRYGEVHPGHAEFIFVTEPFLLGEQVKDEHGGGPSTDVLKLNALRTFNTGIYSYRTMTSTFRPVDLTAFPHALKSTTGVQDWCGQVFQQANRTGNGWRVELRSYFQNPGDAAYELGDVWLEDEFWLLLRLNPGALPTGDLRAVPGAVDSRFRHLPVKDYAASASLREGRGESLYRVMYRELDRELRIRFDNEFPHVIRAWEERNPSGTTRAVLQDRIMNSYYWRENQPEDAGKRRALGLAPVAD
jgi:hypothetical protein